MALYTHPTYGTVTSATASVTSTILVPGSEFTASFSVGGSYTGRVCGVRVSQANTKINSVLKTIGLVGISAGLSSNCLGSVAAITYRVPLVVPEYVFGESFTISFNWNNITRTTDVITLIKSTVPDSSPDLDNNCESITPSRELSGNFLVYPLAPRGPYPYKMKVALSTSSDDPESGRGITPRRPSIVRV